MQGAYSVCQGGAPLFGSCPRSISFKVNEKGGGFPIIWVLASLAGVHHYLGTAPLEGTQHYRGGGVIHAVLLYLNVVAVWAFQSSFDAIT